MVQMNVPALKKTWVLDAQWTDCPEEVERVVRNLWRERELGNDNYMIRTTIKSLEGDDGEHTANQWYWGETAEEQKGWVEEPFSVMPLVNYLREKGVEDDEPVILHWWW